MRVCFLPFTFISGNLGEHDNWGEQTSQMGTEPTIKYMTWALSPHRSIQKKSFAFNYRLRCQLWKILGKGIVGKSNSIFLLCTLEFSKEDMAKSLLHMISNDIGQLACLYAKQHNLSQVYFGGFFIRGHPVTMHTITYSINFFSKVGLVLSRAIKRNILGCPCGPIIAVM